ncbi:hypothetical protein GDO78_018071 [Eleutherodactylus coqui]|uniref:Uncharacterized protein n=1 Tax=Eleutherodactylus coqui TaxID=57060 RepID=A0A8J6C7F2_ELECQ|nr:hypothetical protein GDO78_018071 [Eleutherodactylus coqui]
MSDCRVSSIDWWPPSCGSMTVVTLMTEINLLDNSLTRMTKGNLYELADRMGRGGGRIPSADSALLNPLLPERRLYLLAVF